MKRTLYLFATVLLLTLIACSGRPRKLSAKDFYFPYREFKTETVYRYVNESDTSDYFNWVMRYQAEGKDTTLITTIWKGIDLKQEEIREKLTSRGTVMTHYFLFTTDSLNNSYQTQCSVLEDTIYKWKFNPGDSCRWRVKYKENGKDMELLKARSFTGDSVSIDCLGKETKCMEFYDRFELTASGGKDTVVQHFSYFVQSYYSRGLGLVKYKVSLPGQKRKDYLLMRKTGAEIGKIEKPGIGF